MLMATSGQAVLGLCKRASRTDSACLLNHVVVVLSKSEGPQKWLAPSGTDVHRVARPIDVSILKKESHRQKHMVMQNDVSIAQNMAKFSPKSVCLLEQLRPLLRTWTFSLYYFMQTLVRVLHVHQSRGVCGAHADVHQYLHGEGSDFCWPARQRTKACAE
jgi:hypothetical protein